MSSTTHFSIYWSTLFCSMGGTPAFLQWLFLTPLSTFSHSSNISELAQRVVFVFAFSHPISCVANFFLAWNYNEKAVRALEAHFPSHSDALWANWRAAHMQKMQFISAARASTFVFAPLAYPFSRINFRATRRHVIFRARTNLRALYFSQHIIQNAHTRRGVSRRQCVESQTGSAWFVSNK